MILLPPEKAFVPQVNVTDKGINVEFKIADGYYMYQSKIVAATAPEGVLAEPVFSKGELKEDEFFGKQTVFHRAALIIVVVIYRWSGLNWIPIIAWRGRLIITAAYSDRKSVV